MTALGHKNCPAITFLPLTPSNQELGANYSSSKHFLLLSADNAPLITCLSLRMRAMRTCLFLFLLAGFSYQGLWSGETPTRFVVGVVFGKMPLTPKMTARSGKPLDALKPKMAYTSQDSEESASCVAAAQQEWIWQGALWI